jgi:low temperature requirement protein LtrA
VVAVGLGASGVSLSAGMIGVSVLGLALSACLWWTYFGEGYDARALEAFRRTDPRRRPVLALNAFYWWHLLILLGIIALASGLERAIAHASATVSLGHALALGGGTALFMLGDVLFRRSVDAGRSRPRLIAAAVSLATIPLGTAVDALAQLAALAVGLLLCLIAERRLESRDRRGARAPVAA